MRKCGRRLPNGAWTLRRKLSWTRPALAAFIRELGYIAQDNPKAAARVAARIEEAARKLRRYPYIGRIGDDPDTREWPVSRTRCLLVYELRGDVVEITQFWHSAQDRPGWTVKDDENI